MNQQTKNAPGAPGMDPKWTSSSKSGIGKALNSGSDVLFTISYGILNEVYYPQEDIACIRDMELIITDGKDFFCEEKRDTEHSVKWLKTGVPAYRVKNSSPEKDFEITKEIITDPYRDTVLQKVGFKAGQKENTYHL